MTEPRTEAGRALLERYGAASDGADMRQRIAAIEAEAADAAERDSAAYRRVVEAALDHSCGAQCNRGDAMHSVDHNLAEALRAALPVVVKDEAERE